jgi:serine/threonine protein kinase/WD40 repeat protein
MNEPGEQEVAIFGAVLQMPAGQRAVYLDQVCASDGALRQRVEAFLASHLEAGAFLEEPAPGARGAVASFPEEVEGTPRRAATPSEKAGDRIGRYKLLQQIGEGGCGVVYMAEQEEPVRRMIALKVIRLGMHTKSVITRFEAERQALAMMDHPNIAKVLDAGSTDAGRPYFVMELVRGIKITDYCDQNQLLASERLDLFVQVCQAIQHAHQKGIIHRDIKPSNILVTVNDGMPVPKVIDFGIAKATQGRLTDQTLFTAFEQFIGTPAYMSPEQAVMTSQDIDTRSDIYSLGVLLYELLTGETPFDAQELMQSGFDEMRRTIREKEPIRPSTKLSTMQEADLTSIARRRRIEVPKLIHSVRGDLDWIVMKALEKDRARRYETSIGLARDVQRYLKDEPVLARPPSRLYLFRKLVRRNKLVFAAGLVVSVSLMLGLGVVTVAAFRIQTAKNDATEKLRMSYLAEARALRTSNQAGQRFASLETVQRAAAIRPDLAARNEAIASLAMCDLRVSKQTTLTGQPRNELGHFDLKLEKYAIGADDGSITIRTVSNGQPLEVIPAQGYTIAEIKFFSTDSRYLSVRYWQEREGLSDWVWDLEQSNAVVRIAQQGADPGQLVFDFAANFSDDAKFFASSRPGGLISVFELNTGKEIKRFPGQRLFNHLNLNPQNTMLACSSEEDPNVEIRDVESGRIIQTLACASGIGALAWSPDGKRVATGCMDLGIYVWDAANGERLAAIQGSTARIISLAFSHEGNLLASAGFDDVIRLWNPDSGQLMASHPGSSWQLKFSPDDRNLLGWQEFARYGSLDVAYSKECRLLYVPRHGGDVSGPEFSADGGILAAGNDDQVRFWDGCSGKNIGSYLLKKSDTQIFHPDGKSMIFIDRKNGVSVLPLERIADPASRTYRFGKPRQLCDRAGFREAALSLDGRHLAVTQESNGLSCVFDLQNPDAKPIVLGPHPRVDRIAISPDGHWVATASWLNSLVKVWDARSGDLERNLPAPGRTVVAFSPDGCWLATSSSEYQLWEVGSWQPKGPPKPGHELPEWNFTAFSPDGRLMARTIGGHDIQLLDTFTEKPLAILEAPVFSGVAKFQFSPDGTQLAAVQRDQQLQLWDLRLIRHELEQMHLDWDMPPYPPAGRTAGASPAILELESGGDGQNPAP